MGEGIGEFLRGAGCDRRLCEGASHLEETGHADELLPQLAARRLRLLVELHETDERLACLDRAMREIGCARDAKEWAMIIKQTAGRTQLGTFAPKFAELNDDVLFGQVWSRTDRLGLRDRSLVTVVALMAMGLTDSSFAYHLRTAKENGIDKDEIVEVITHAAFYVGWPKAWAVFRMAKEVWGDDAAGTAPVAAGTTADDNGRAAFEAESIFPIGKPNDAYAEYFDGQSYLAPVSTEQISIANVTFEPGCRNHWHIHHATEGGGQLLLCVAGHGWYQEWGKPARALVPGDVVNIPANVKHWHGAAANSWFGHLAMSVPGTDTSNEWCEPVSDEDYANLGKRVPGMRPHASRTAKRPPTDARRAPGRYPGTGGRSFEATPRHARCLWVLS